MPRLAYETREFRDDYVRADNTTRRRIDNFIAKFDENAGRDGTRLKMLNQQTDRRVRTARVDDATRAVLAHVGADVYALLRVMPHDAANNFAGRVRLDVSRLTGLPRLITLDPATVRDDAGKAVGAPSGPLAHRSDDDLFIAGIPKAVISPLRACVSTPELTEFASVLAAHDPMIELAVEALIDRHDSIDEVVAKLLTLAGAEDQEERRDDTVADATPTELPEYDTEDVEAALRRPGAGERFRVIDSSQELVDALQGDFADWQIFLHPLQYRAAYEATYSGPARVSGGAGTGKTVVLIHRVKALIDRGDPEDPPRILVTTYTEHLRADLRVLLTQLIGEQALEAVEIETIDKLARVVHETIDGSPVTPLDAQDELRLWDELSRRLPATRRDAVFLRNEYRHVILAHGVRSIEDYLATPRPGRGVRLSRDERRSLWPLFESFEARTRGVGRRSVLQLTEDVAALFEQAPADLYDHVLVDEAQDLHPAQWRLLRALVPPGPDDLFIVGDAFQRIHGNTASLRSVGIETRGRSVRLRRNYRSTHQIIGWALGVIGRESVFDIDDHGTDLRGYHSVRTGPAPEVHEAANRDAELERLAQLARGWMSEGYCAHDIAIVARTEREVEELLCHLAKSGIQAAAITADGRQTQAVNVATMHRVKGLEFACVAVSGLASTSIPLADAICPADVDPAQHRADMETERALIYVSATRARDQLALTWSGSASSLLPATTQKDRDE